MTAWEDERLTIFVAAEAARRTRDRGIKLNAPEAIALICEAMLEASRAGADLVAVENAGRAAVGLGQVVDGVRELVDQVALEVLLEDGVRLVVLVDPLGNGLPFAPDGPGAIRSDREPDDPLAGRPRRLLEVRSASERVIRVSSHHPFDRVNERLVFDRTAATGFRLDLPAGASERWEPGETKTVTLVAFGGKHALQRGVADRRPAAGSDP